MTAVRPVAGETLNLSFDDNSLLPLLYGEHDRHLSRIEKQLGVLLRGRGNQIAVSGPQSAREAAGTALRALYERLSRGRSVDGGEVDAAIRLATGAAAGGDRDEVIEQVAGGRLVIRTRKREILARSPGQSRYIATLLDNELVFGLGPAGTGKTYLAVAMAVSLMLRGQVERLVLSRPAVEAGERLGFLPGDMREKIDPYLQPLYDALHDMLPAEQVARRLESGEIEIAPLAFMRGRTLSNAFVILDEAQNTTPMQMKMFLTRLGENARMVVTGDPTQVDLAAGARSGLDDAVALLEGTEGVAVARLGDADVVRHALVGRIVRAYDARQRKDQPDGDSG